ncbi:DUF551 domain-containing protein [Bilifractor porci]|nr:DUF551 domain-containing protein [Bilifractor porci]
MSDDIISRAAALDGLSKLRMIDTYKIDGDPCLKVKAIDVYEMLKQLPSAQPEQRWIPCSERLPEDEQPILFSTTTGRVHQGRFHMDNSINQWYSSLDKMRAYNNTVNAWMPLPEPYKAESEGDE